MSFALVPLASDGEAVLSLEDAKLHLRVDADDDGEDTLIASLRDGAVAAVEFYTKVMLVAAERTWLGRFGSRIVLGTGPVTAVSAISYLDTAGADVDLVVGDWRLALGELVPGVGKRWPTAADGDGVVTVTFMAGYTDLTRPATLVTAVRLMLAYLYENRGDAPVDGVAGLSPGAQSWCDLTRLPTI